MQKLRLSDLRNLGPNSAAALAAAGIDSPSALAQAGAVIAYLAAKRQEPASSLNLLWALEGALSNRDWREVAREDRLRLLTELEAAQETKQAARGGKR